MVQSMGLCQALFSLCSLSIPLPLLRGPDTRVNEDCSVKSMHAGTGNLSMSLKQHYNNCKERWRNPNRVKTTAEPRY